MSPAELRNLGKDQLLARQKEIEEIEDELANLVDELVVPNSERTIIDTILMDMNELKCVACAAKLYYPQYCAKCFK